ncbi:hypothetical protein LJC57_07400 [Parabacteroides sp. OttesenSCG-928-G07]|nr:hypothetical protein [Parabacteroides sp. OttesenSCG-928-G07]
MLLSGFILLFSVIVPHHHHEDGGICIHLFDQADDHESDDHQHDSAHHQHDCDCSGHNIAFNTTILPGHSSEEDATLFLMPLYTLLEYVYPPEITVINSLFYSDRTVYIESLHDTWITVATGLRAPPVLVG